MSRALMTVGEYFKTPQHKGSSQSKSAAAAQTSAAEAFQAPAETQRRRAEADEAVGAASSALKPNYRINIAQLVSFADFMPITAPAPKLGRTTAQMAEEIQAMGRGDMTPSFEEMSEDVEPRATIAEIWRGDTLLASVNLYGAVTIQRFGVNARTGLNLAAMSDAEIVDHMATIDADGRVLASSTLQRSLDAEDPPMIDRATDGRMDEFEMLDAMKAQDGARSGPTLAYHRIEVLSQLLGDSAGPVTVKRFDALSGQSAAGETPTDPYAGSRSLLHRLNALQQKTVADPGYGVKAV